MEIRQLESFLQIVQCGSFRRAAKALHLSQPSLSGRIRGLEDELKTPLFLRTGSGVRLTEMGEALLPFAKSLLEMLRQAESAVSTVRDVGRDTVTIATPRALATYVLPSLLKTFQASHPGIHTHVKTGRSSEVLQMVANGDADIGIGRPMKHPEVVTMYLYPEEMALVTHPRHAFALAGAASMQEIAHEPLIVYHPGRDRVTRPLPSSVSYLARLTDACKEEGGAPNVTMRLGSIEAIKRMVALGTGVAFLAQNTVTQEVRQGTLAMVRVTDCPIRGCTCAMVRRMSYYRPAVRAFLGLLRRIYNADISAIENWAKAS